MTDNVTIAAVDGTDALAFVVIRPGETEGGVSIEAAAKGLDKPSAAYVLRHVANQWDGGQGDQSATLSALNTLAERWERMAKAAPDLGSGLLIDEPTPLQLQQRERADVYRRAAADLREVLVSGRIPHDLMTDAELGD
ncbi:hypothetical protein [Streptomyces sp. NPDC053367]|uniref:hypothetical protein n=1 Tax=Streptomyces sp. NPDC053367 TaxID=3365700 RepID=UPI0037CD06DD